MEDIEAKARHLALSVEGPDETVAAVLARHWCRAARDLLATVESELTAMGAHAWARRARAETVAVSGRISAGLKLTTMEDQAAGLAAQGSTNAEIASALFLSVRTVESHLSAAYRRLNVRSWTELAAALRDR